MRKFSHQKRLNRGTRRCLVWGQCISANISGRLFFHFQIVYTEVRRSCLELKALFFKTRWRVQGLYSLWCVTLNALPWRFSFLQHVLEMFQLNSSTHNICHISFDPSVQIVCPVLTDTGLEETAAIFLLSFRLTSFFVLFLKSSKVLRWLLPFSAKLDPDWSTT